jgi:anthranilate phosphoribosyltransferase
MLKEIIQKLSLRENLSTEKMKETMNEVLLSDNETQIAAFISLLRAKGETVEELVGLVAFMRDKMVRVNTQSPVLDIVGTGGDGFNTINISTASALLAASCGVRVVKHGNRSVSSLCGSADVLEALGININLNADEVGTSVAKHCFGFCYAPNFHPTLLKIRNIRNKLGLPSTFNLIPPLLNPANAQFLMIGVADKQSMNIIADTLLMFGQERALVFHCQGLDELCCVGLIDIIEINQSTKRSYQLDPLNYGFPRCSIADLQGGSAKTNAEMILEILNGKPNAMADSIILNAGFANYLYGITKSLENGIQLAREKLADGSAAQLVLTLKNQNKLQEILSNKAKEVAELKNPQRKSLKKALSPPGLSIISEVKRKSPSNGLLKKSIDPTFLVDAYLKGGAASISVLTDEKFFSGSLTDLKIIAEKLKEHPVPVLRKDFIIDKSQIAESVVFGADAVLLIVTILKEKTKEFLEYTESKGLEALVEVHTLDELKIAIDADAKIIAINNRNLKTFSVDINISLDLIKNIPPHITKVSASGIHTPEDFKKMHDAGFDAVLVGEALMISDDPAQLMMQLRGEG